ncbi:hypothetical protein H2204_007536 [Knufia peltigerae]|uniref:ASST-domain-containing protein n=1 Tax=Knufia peltigerae TaxID=1002370 RepID=A0AA39CXW0_9EURO|nr:hypothetical protein H2204_007536 [Knufia peltigerae]
MYLSLLLTLYLLHLSFVVRALGHHDWSNQTLCSANSFQIANNGTDSTIWPWQTYRSSNATPPMLQINTTGKNLSPGLLFFAPFDGSSTPGAKEQVLIVMTDKGDLVWNGPEQHNADLRVQTFNDEPVLVYWSGEGTAGTSLAVGHGYGENFTHTVCPNLDITLPPGATARCAVDVHEALITSRDTMLFTAYNTTPFDLSSIGGPRNGWALDSLVFEVNITTGEVLFGWSPLRHLPLNSTHYPLNGAGVNASVPFDAFHVNSIQLIDGGHYLINSRHTWSTYLVDTDGKIIWEINGLDGGDFGKLPEGASFSWQHDARFSSINQASAFLTWFGNNNDEFTSPNDLRPSTGLKLQVNLPPSRDSPPTLINNFTDPQDPIGSWSQGSYQELPSGNGLLGYGATARVAEYAPPSSAKTSQGEVVWSAAFGYGDLVSSYRVSKQEWHATPAADDPSLVVLAAEANDTLTHCAGSSVWRGYVSWNGATDVTSWEIYVVGTSNTSIMRSIGQVEKMGFETEFVVPVGSAYVQVGAVESYGARVVRNSTAVKVGS